MSLYKLMSLFLVDPVGGTTAVLNCFTLLAVTGSCLA